MEIDDERYWRKKLDVEEQHYTSEKPRNKPGKIIKTTVSIVPAAPGWRVVCEYRNYSKDEHETEIANIVAWQYVSTVRRGRYWCDSDNAETTGEPMIVQSGSIMTVQKAMMEWTNYDDINRWDCRCILEPGEEWPPKEPDPKPDAQPDPLDN